MKKKIYYKIGWVLVLLIILVIVSILSLCVGSSNLGLRELWGAVTSDKASLARSIVFDLRLPRIILGFAVGGSLALAGTILQGLFRNPMVEPYTLGISGGAALGISVCIAFNLNMVLGIYYLPVFGFAGAAAIVFILYFLGLRQKKLPVQGVILLGVMITFISSSLLMLIMSLSRTENLQRIVFWMMGSLEQSRWELIILNCALAVAGLIVTYFFAVDLNAFSLGEEEAVHLGINIGNTRKVLFIVASVLTSVSVSVAGIIGFVGLIIPHFMRMLVGNDHRALLITSFLAGSSFLILSDTIARTIIAPLELPVGVITGMVGGVLVIYTLSARRSRV